MLLFLLVTFSNYSILKVSLNFDDFDIKNFIYIYRLINHKLTRTVKIKQTIFANNCQPSSIDISNLIKAAYSKYGH